MSMRVLTYTNPFKINENTDLWELVTTHPHFCASDTLVQGLNRIYSRSAFSLIRSIDDLLSALMGNYTDNPVNDMRLYLTISSVIRDWPDNELKQTFLFNKADIVHAIQLLIPLECESALFDQSLLTIEQKKLLEIYDIVKSSNCFEAFASLKKLTFNDLKNAISECGRKEIEYLFRSPLIPDSLSGNPEHLKTLEGAKQCAQDAIILLEKTVKKQPLKSREYKNLIESLHYAILSCEAKASSYYSKIIIHGLHKITPVYYFLFRLLESLGCEIIFLINYADNLPAIYNTWKNVYSWCDTRFEYTRPLDLQCGNPMGRLIAGTLSGHNIQPSATDKLISYDNLTSFALHKVASVYETAREGSHGNDPLSKMDTQFYAVSSDELNDMLQMYYPEQFREKPFLSYPIGQFILGLYQMWNFDEKKIELNYNSLCECAVAGIYSYKTNLLSTLAKTRLYFNDVSTVEQYLERINLIQDAINLSRRDECYQGFQNISFFSLSDNEIKDLKNYINELSGIIFDLFNSLEGQIDYIKHFQKLMEEITSHYTTSEALTETEITIIREIGERLSANSLNNVPGNAQDVKDALAFFLSEKKNREGSRWIVRDFEQIDGAVLLSRSTKAKKYHFSMLSNEHMLSKGPHELPWPLEEKMFNNYTAVSTALLAVTAGHKEHRNFLKYSLFYGSFFSEKEMEFSYIADENGEEQTPYFLFNAMKIPVLAETPRASASFFMQHSSGSLSEKFSSNDSAKELFTVCPYKYLVNQIFNTKIIYSSEFHIKYYLTFFLTCVVRDKCSHINDIERILDQELKRLYYYFPFFGDIVLNDIKNSAAAELKSYGLTPASRSIKIRKENFLLAKWQDYSTGKDLFQIPHNVDELIFDYLKSNRLYPKRSELPPKQICDNCSYGDLCLRNYYDAHIEDEVELNYD